MSKKTSIIASKSVLLREKSGVYAAIPACIVVRDGLIAEIRKCDENNYAQNCHELEQKNKVTVTRFDNALVAPSFVNAHTHLAMSFFRGVSARDLAKRNLVEDFFFHIESKLTAEDVRAFARMGAYECLSQGVGFVWDHYYFGTALADACVDVGLGAVVAPTLQDLSGPGANLFEQGLIETKTIAESKAYAEAGVFAAVGPHATDTVSEGLWTRAREMAVTLNIPSHAHVAQSYEEYARALERHGCSPVTYLERIGYLNSPVSAVWAHCIYAPRADLKKLDTKKNVLMHCPFSQLVFHFLAPGELWTELNIPWGVATDCVASNDSMNVQKELKLIAGMPKFLYPTRSEFKDFLEQGNKSGAERVNELRMQNHATAEAFADENTLLDKALYTPGRAHPACTVGTLEKGALANITVYDLQHPAFWPQSRLERRLAMSDTVPAIVNVMTMGTWRGKDYDFQRSLTSSAEYRGALQEANSRLESLITRI